MKPLGRIEEPQPARLFVSLISSEDGVLRKTLEDLQNCFGATDQISERFPFSFTDYYRKEMGEQLFRHFVSFGRLIRMSDLPGIKRSTNDLEKAYCTPEGNRRINIDPGYVCLSHIILATTKGYAHRPYLRDGIYADLTLIYLEKSFRALDWTYPDYRQREVIELFNRFRKSYHEQLKGKEPGLC